jgi:hypothetical protein
VWEELGQGRASRALSREGSSAYSADRLGPMRETEQDDEHAPSRTGRRHPAIERGRPDPVEQWIHVFEFRDGQISRARNFTSLEAAVESLGTPSLTPIWSRTAD